MLQELLSNILSKFPDIQEDKGSLRLNDSGSFLELMNFLHTTEGYYFDHLASISGVHIADEKLEVVYHINSLVYNHSLEIILSCGGQSAPSLTGIWKGADWHERETFDLFGIRFDNHPDLRRILLPANWEGHPMRKDYQEQETFHGIKVKY